MTSTAAVKDVALVKADATTEYVHARMTANVAAVASAVAALRGGGMPNSVVARRRSAPPGAQRPPRGMAASRA